MQRSKKKNINGIYKCEVTSYDAQTRRDTDIGYSWIRHFPIEYFNIEKHNGLFFVNVTPCAIFELFFL